MANKGNPIDYPQPNSQLFRDNYDFPERQPMINCRDYGRGRARGFRSDDVIEEKLRYLGLGSDKHEATGYSDPRGQQNPLGSRE